MVRPEVMPNRVIGKHIYVIFIFSLSLFVLWLRRCRGAFYRIRWLIFVILEGFISRGQRLSFVFAHFVIAGRVFIFLYRFYLLSCSEYVFFIGMHMRTLKVIRGEKVLGVNLAWVSDSSVLILGRSLEVSSDSVFKCVIEFSSRARIRSYSLCFLRLEFVVNCRFFLIFRILFPLKATFFRVRMDIFLAVKIVPRVSLTAFVIVLNSTWLF